VSRSDRDVDIAILGAGSASSALVGALQGDPSVVVFEPGLVGGSCPFDACIPSKSLLHDAAVGRSWRTASERRLELTDHRSDARHVEGLLDAGDVELIRERASIVDEHRVASDSTVVTAEHIVLATGAYPVTPELDGLAEVADRVWYSADALRTTTPPQRLVVAGGGVVGCELTQLFTGFGTEVVVIEPEPRLFAELHPEVSGAIEAALRATGADVRLGVMPTAVRPHGDGVAVFDDRGDEHRADRLLLAVGRRPAVDGVGLESLGLSTAAPLPVDEHGRLRSGGSVWAIGDVAGREQYTHAAVHHARVVADHLTGSAVRRLDDVVPAACMFIDPPVLTVGPSHLDTVDEPDVVWVSVEVAATAARATTDERDGVLAVAADRRTRRLVAAHGIGAGFDELVHAVVVAIDGDIPIDRLVQSMVPFPTMGDVLHAALHRLLTTLDT
jgi:pyruvate/2-oxoglutarate dehydrogenase complex dihydrolipoamide dehydrogenase (E3) component